MTDDSARRVQFYVLPDAGERRRLKFACTLTEQAYLAGKRVYVWLDDPGELQQFDELLWTFADRSFVPHERFVDMQQWQQTPVLLGCETQPMQPYDVLINLGSAVPAAATNASQIAEIVDGDESGRQAGRARFRHYRDQGLKPESQNIPADWKP